MTTSPFDAADLDQLRDRGIAAEEALRQLRLLRNPPGFARLDRACTVEDGIERIPESDFPRLLGLHDTAARAGRILKFVPASGAATRMFHDLLASRSTGRAVTKDEVVAAAESGSSEARRLLQFMREIRRFPFYQELWEALARGGSDLDLLAERGPFEPVLHALLDASGLGCADLPKALLKFHRYEGGARTAFEEHLVEAAGTVRDRDGACRVHLSISPEHMERFRSFLDRVRPACEKRHGVRLDVRFSVQKPSTDTLAADGAGAPFRDREGGLLFRPGGHGSLIENLNELDGDVVLVKNIDNIQPDRLRPPTELWKKLLAGRLLKLQDEAFVHRARLRSSRVRREWIEEAAEFVAGRFGQPAPAGAAARETREFLIARLDRPLRVCGVVRNTGEPGGGPFWVRGSDGAVTLQIVEGAQIDKSSPAQRAILASSTHFNPVDLACGLRDEAGNPFDLHRFIDPEAVIVARKSHEGRELLALERPGLWNGAMAGWNTVFVEVPPETFTPVKTVLDLLRPEHQPLS